MLHIMLSFFCISCAQSCKEGPAKDMTIIVRSFGDPKGELTVPKREWAQMIKAPEALRWYLRDLLLKNDILKTESLPTAEFRFNKDKMPSVEESGEVVLTLAHSRDFDFCLKEWGELETSRRSQVCTKFSVEGSHLLFCLIGSNEVGKYFGLKKNITCSSEFLEDIFAMCILSHVESADGSMIPTVRRDVTWGSIPFRTAIIPFFNENFIHLKEAKLDEDDFYFTGAVILLLSRYLGIGIGNNPVPDPISICDILNKIKSPEEPEVEGTADAIIRWVNRPLSGT